MVAQASNGYYRTSPYGRWGAEDYEADAPESNPSVELPYLRSVIRPDYANLPTEQLRALMESQYGEGAADEYDEYLEGWLSGVGKFISKAAPVVANIGGGIIKGATAG